MNIAIVLAGGSGTRIGGSVPKQFLKIGGKTIMEHTLDAFTMNPGIDEIAVVVRQDYEQEVRHLVTDSGYRKVRKILLGGKERYHSSLAALNAYTDDNDVLLFHDCVRPLVSQKIISDCLETMKHNDVCEVAIPSTDTIVEVDNEGRICRIPKRAQLRNAQTPQCFRRSVIRKAFDLAMQDPDFQPTDDVSVVFRYLPEIPIKVIPGDPDNIKITYKEDFQFAERLLNS